MLKLGSPESGWKDILPGVRVQFAPIGIKSVRAARIACGIALKEREDDFLEASDALSREMIRRGVVAWEGVGDANGSPLAPGELVPVLNVDGQPEMDGDGKPKMQAAVELFLANPDAFEAAERAYVYPWLVRDREKNVSAASSNGTSAGATAESGTASSPAQLGKQANDVTPTRKRARKPAPTGSTSPAPKKAKPSSK